MDSYSTFFWGAGVDFYSGPGRKFLTFSFSDSLKRGRTSICTLGGGVLWWTSIWALDLCRGGRCFCPNQPHSQKICSIRIRDQTCLSPKKIAPLKHPPASHSTEFSADKRRILRSGVIFTSRDRITVFCHVTGLVIFRPLRWNLFRFLFLFCQISICFSQFMFWSFVLNDRGIHQKAETLTMYLFEFLCQEANLFMREGCSVEACSTTGAYPPTKAPGPARGGGF